MSEQKTGRCPVELVAQVQSMELDLNHDGSYRLLLEDGSTIIADFTAPQWAHIEGMHNHGKYSVKIVGEGDYADGRLRRIVSIDLKKTERVIPPRDPNERPFWEYWVEASKRIPEEELAKIPPDFSRNLDHYLYGAPKREEE